jgi:hypothetical protein
MKRQLAIILYFSVFGFSSVPSYSWAQAKTAKACTEEWRANKADFQARHITEKAYVAECRGGTSATPTAAPAAPPPAPAPAPPPVTTARPAPTPVAPAERAPANGSPLFTSEAQAKARCPDDTVVWANLRSKIYHFSGTHNYGNTKAGAYMCEKDTAAQGIRAPQERATSLIAFEPVKENSNGAP